MTDPPTGMVTIAVGTSIEASVKHARLLDAGIDAKLFDPTVGGVASYGRATGGHSATAQVFVPRAEAGRAAQILATSAALPVDPDELPYVEPTTMTTGKRVIRIVASLVLFAFVALFVIQIAGFFR